MKKKRETKTEREEEEETDRKRDGDRERHTHTNTATETERQKALERWKGSVVEHRTLDRKVAGSSPGSQIILVSAPVIYYIAHMPRPKTTLAQNCRDEAEKVLGRSQGTTESEWPKTGWCSGGTSLLT